MGSTLHDTVELRGSSVRPNEADQVAQPRVTRRINMSWGNSSSRIALGAFALCAALLTSPVRAADSTDPIKLTLHDWTGQLITTQLMGEVLKKAG